MSIGVPVTWLCGDHFCMEDAEVRIVCLAPAIAGHRIYLCAEHLTQWRERAAEDKLVEGTDFRVEPLKS